MTSSSEGLRHQKEQDHVGDEELKFAARVVARGRQVKDQLEDDHQGKCAEREKFWGQDQLFRFPAVLLNSPQEEKNSSTNLEDGLRPFLHGAKRQNGECKQDTDRNAKEFHGF